MENCVTESIIDILSKSGYSLEDMQPISSITKEVIDIILDNFPKSNLKTDVRIFQAAMAGLIVLQENHNKKEVIDFLSSAGLDDNEINLAGLAASYALTHVAKNIPEKYNETSEKRLFFCKGVWVSLMMIFKAEASHF